MTVLGRSPRVLLVSLRDAADPMAVHELACFADQAAVPREAFDVHVMQQGRLPSAGLQAYDAVFFGGSGAYSVLDDVAWIRDGFDALRTVLDARRPAWASCFGFQGLAVALGGEVVRDDARTELGSVRLTLTDAGRACPLMGRLPHAGFWAQEGHHDHVVVLPPGVTRLAVGEVSPEQACRVDGAPFWASQFHPELTARTTVDRFLHYLDLYHPEGGDQGAQATLAALRDGVDSPEVGQLLAWLVREGSSLR
ncbi:MAG: synthase [Pseudomonadota bacterium]|jgi:GMP synthase (glutamine-hydrolysing)